VPGAAQHSPHEAIARIEAELASRGPESVTLIESSLGGSMPSTSRKSTAAKRCW